MNGQWIGSYKGTNTGLAVIEFDDRGDHFEGVAYAYDSDPKLPGTFAAIRTPTKSPKFKLSVDLIPIDPITGDLTQWDRIKDRHPGVVAAAKADTEWELGDQQLKVKWTTDIGTNGTAELPKSKAAMPSEYQPQQQDSWTAFKRMATELEPYRYIFRGQEDNNWRLRTHYHRTSRANLLKFIAEDIPTLHRHLSGLTRHVFALGNPIENGAFYSLVQHHGYPTPLLDWTYSPFIAAYFAYKGLRRAKQLPERSVRIFVFDRKQWCNDYRQSEKLSPARPHFSVLEALAINNPRMVPQQALSSVTNVDDVETYIKEKEREAGKEYLKVIDLPATDRREAMQELALMGITAGSLFPGLDGACEQLRERFFDL